MPKPSILPLRLLPVLLTVGLAHASDPVDRIDLTCVEQPMRHVVFGDGGRVDYREEPPRETAPIRLAVIKAGEGDDSSATGGVAARIESDLDYLRTERATWLPDRSIEAPRGRLRINLENNVVTLSETGANSETWFRRFDCQSIVVAAE